MRIALDTNILAYAEGVQRTTADAAKVDASRKLITSLLADMDQTPVAPVQALLELFHVLVRKGGRSPAEAAEAVEQLAQTFELAPTDAEVVASAVERARDRHWQIFDAVIFAAAGIAGCELLVSEDLQDGFRSGRLTVASPFADPLHPAIEALLAE